MSKQNKVFIAGLIVVALLVSALTFYIRYERSHEISEETQRLFAGEAESVTYTDTVGNPVGLEQYLGKVLIVTSWASWSPFTTTDLTQLNDLMTKYDRSKVVALGINRMETRDQAQRYMTTMPEFPNVVLVIDTADHFYKSVGGYAMPETLVFNQKGEVIEHIRGTIVKDNLEVLVDSLLEQEN